MSKQREFWLSAFRGDLIAYLEPIAGAIHVAEVESGKQPEAKCENCQFFRPTGAGNDAGKCQQRSPVTTFPNVNKDDWCGDWKGGD